MWPVAECDLVSIAEVEDGYEDEPEGSKCPPELAQVKNEAYAMHFKAKQRIAEVKKLRQYFKRPDPEERKCLLAEKMKTSPCHRCGELGHWSRKYPSEGTCDWCSNIFAKGF